MVAVGFMELLILALMGGGAFGPDLVNLVPPRSYFQARTIETTPASMMSLATKEPKDAKTQVQQLLALRQLTVETEALKKAPKYQEYRAALEQIAAGKKAADTLGFAQDYAQRLLARLDGKPAAKAPPAKLLDGLTWFPAETKLVFALDVRPRGPEFPPGLGAMEKLFAKIPENVKEQLYGIMEQTGNIRVERLAGAYVPRGKGQVFLRVTGKANAAWLEAAARQHKLNVEQVKVGKQKEAVLFLKVNGPGDQPGVALLGNTDLIVGGDLTPQSDNTAIVQKLLENRDSNKNAARGALLARLKKAPAGAVGLLVGDLPDDLRQLARSGVAEPRSIDAFLEPTVAGLDFTIGVGMNNADGAKTAVAMISKGRAAGVKLLKQLGNQPNPTPIPVQSIINLLESLQLQQENDTVRLRLIVPYELARALPSIFGGLR